MTSQSDQKYLKVITDRQISTITQLSPSLQKLERFTYWDKFTEIKDVFPFCWMLFIASPEQNQIRFAKNPNLKLAGPIGIFLPAYTVLEWNISPGQLDWTVYISQSTLKRNLEQPSWLSWNPHWNPKNIEAIDSILSQHQGIYPIYSPPKTTWVSLRAKQYLDQNFLEEFSVQELADQLRCCRSTLTRHFKKSFGISPQEYRHRLRIAYASHLVLRKENNATECCFHSGFNDYSNFKDAFKKMYGAPPSSYQWESKDSKYAQPAPITNINREEL